MPFEEVVAKFLEIAFTVLKCEVVVWCQYIEGLGVTRFDIAAHLALLGHTGKLHIDLVLLFGVFIQPALYLVRHEDELL